MEQVQLESDLNLAVYINCITHFALTLQDIFDEFITVLQLELERTIGEGGAE